MLFNWHSYMHPCMHDTMTYRPYSNMYRPPLTYTHITPNTWRPVIIFTMSFISQKLRVFMITIFEVIIVTIMQLATEAQKVPQI